MSSRASRQEKKRNKVSMGVAMLNEIEKPKNGKGTANEYWYKKPRGLIIIGVAITLISAAIIGVFKHLTTPVLSSQNVTPKEVQPRSSFTMENITLNGNNLVNTGIENNNSNAQVIMKNARIIGTKTGIKSNANNTQVIMDNSEIEAKQKGIDIHLVPNKK